MRTSFIRTLIACFFFLPLWAFGKPSIAILPLVNSTGDTNAAHWRFMASCLLNAGLKEAQSLRVLPDSSVQFAFHVLKLDPDSQPTIEEARKVGKVIEAGYVVWGSYRRGGPGWGLDMRLLNVATGDAATNVTASFSEWPKGAILVTRTILHRMGIPGSRDAESRVELPFTTSTVAFEIASRALADLHQDQPLSAVLTRLNSAVPLGGPFAFGDTAAAHCLLLQGRFGEAEHRVRLAIESCPNYSPAHMILGRIYMAIGSNQTARAELTEAARIDPNDSTAYAMLSDVCTIEGEKETALSLLKKAHDLAPFDPLVEAKLGRAYADLGRRELAREHLKAAEKVDCGREVGVQQVLAEGYWMLKDLPETTKCYERFVVTSDRLDMQQNPAVRLARNQLAELKARLTPQSVSAIRPRDFTQDELTVAYKYKLTPSERRMVVNPFAITTAMEQFAEKAAGNATNELAKARQLFQTLAPLVRPADPDKSAAVRTAAEAFSVSSSTSAPLTCQDYAFLYIALARHLKLKAYFVVVDKDYKGELVSHACAGVFADNKAFLVDLTYLWFGVPHETFYFENDLRAVAVYLSQSVNTATQTVGLKLAPAWAKLRFHVAMELASSGRVIESRQILDTGLELDSTTWLSFCARGAVELAEKDWERAAKDLQRCLALNPDYNVAHYQLGLALFHDGKPEAAREQYQTYLTRATDQIAVARVRGYLTEIDEKSKY